MSKAARALQNAALQSTSRAFLSWRRNAFGLLATREDGFLAGG
jgi:hypothetical protein